MSYSLNRSIKPSAWIAAATGGLYSHAAIYVRNYQQFEAVSKGVGFSFLKPVRAECANGVMSRILCSTADYKQLAVFRCPTQFRKPGTDESTLYLEMSRLLRALDGSEYKSALGFANVESAFDVMPKPVRQRLLKAAGLFSRDAKKVICEEYFCSELATKVLSKLGMSVLKKPSPDDSVSPNSLADPARSNLEEVADVVCSADPLCDCPSSSFLTAAQNVATDLGTSGAVKVRRELTVLANQLLSEMRRRTSSH